MSAVVDDPNLVSCVGVAPTMALAQRAGTADLVSSMLTLKAIGGVNPHLKVPALVAGMVAGADSIDDMDVLRHGGMCTYMGTATALPPFSIAAGDRDCLVPHQQSIALARAIDAAGGHAVLTILPEIGHGSPVDAIQIGPALEFVATVLGASS